MQCNAMQCNAMQCNAMQCNAMQCNAMQCNAMQCNAMQCNAMQCNAMQCNAMQCNAMQCNAMQCNAMQCNAMQCNAMQCNAMQCNAMQCNAMQCNAMQCNAMQCNAMQCNAIQYNKYVHGYNMTGSDNPLTATVVIIQATKAFDKVSYKVLFDILLKKNVCPRIVNLLYYMYSNQLCHVKWGDETSASFSISNGVKQGGVISPLLFSLYIDELFLLLKQSGIGCHVGLTYAGAFGYADDIALVAPSLSSLKQMISICEEFAKSHSIVFNPSKTKLLCFNLDPLCEIPPIYLNGVQISIVEHEKHLGNYISTNISDRNIIANVCDLYQRSNLLISDFRVCDSQTLDCLHKTYCMHMYGSELWNLNCKYVDEFRVAWRKIKRRIWRLPNRAHNAIVQNLSYNIDDQLETRMIKFIHMCLNHDNDVCRSISLSKLLCKNSTFSSNYNYLSCKYELSNKDWYLDTNHLLGKVRLKCQLNITCSSWQSVIELCEIRDGLSSCEALSNDDVCKLIELICLE